MRWWGKCFCAVAALWPLTVSASVPQLLAPQGSFTPMHQTSAPHPPTGEARFFPLPPRKAAKMMPLKPVNAASAPVGEATALPAEEPDMPREAVLPPVKAGRASLSEEDAKLLLSIFNPGD